VEQLITSVMRPGGTMDAVLPEIPQFGQVRYAGFVAAFPGHTHQISNCGHPVPMRVVMHIKFLMFWLKHQRRISCIPDMAAITVPTLRAWRNQMTFEGGHTVTTTQPVINDNDWANTLKYLSEYLAANLGEKGNPLYYVIHPLVDVPAEAGDPSMGYGTVDLEMIARGHHKVWETMHNIFSENMCYIYIKGATRAKKGRDAYQRLFDHYLGPNTVINMASADESKLNATQYTDEKRIFDFERYVRIHTKKHSVLNGLVEHGYSGIDESSNVHILLNGIMTPQYDVVKAHILASTKLKTSFARSFKLYKDFIKETKADPPRNVSEIQTRVRDKGGKGNGKDNDVGGVHGGGAGSSNSKRKAPEMEDKLYSQAAYMAFSEDHKDASRQKRLDHRHVPIRK
jgi:hypothetical protein